MRAAVEALRQLEAGRIVVAVPTAALSTVREMQPDVDELVAIMTPADFSAVGEWYQDFSQTSDREVQDLLAHSHSLAEPT